MAVGLAFGLMGVFFMGGLYVAGAMGATSLILTHFFSDAPLWNQMATRAWTTYTNWTWLAIPLFIMMGELVLRSGLAERMYTALSRWVALIPGGLLHTNIASCALFAACAGSNVATAATISRVALPSFSARGYNERMVLGSLAAGGTLGILIPPSILLLIYAIATRQSIPRMFLAGFIPAAMMVVSFMIMIAIATKIWPSIAPHEEGGSLFSIQGWWDRIVSIVPMLPIFGLISMVLGTIYMGIFLPSEAAACGVSGAFIMAVTNNSVPVLRAAFLRILNGSGITSLMPRVLSVKLRTMGEERPLDFGNVKEAVRVNYRMLHEAFLSTVRTTAMIMLILFVAFSLQTTFGFLMISHDMSDWIAGLNLSPTQFILVLVAFYLVLGTFMESYSMLFLTLPIVLPPLFSAGVDPFAFGIVLIILVELAQITPPQGLCLYVLQGARRDISISGSIGAGNAGSSGTIADVYIGVIPFIGCMFLVLGLLIAFPEIVSWLPDLVRG